MWIKQHSNVYQGLTKERIWNLWIDVNNWHVWDPDIEYARIEEPFEAGSHFFMKPIGMSEIRLKLVEVEHKKKYTDHYKFFGADLFGTHELEEVPEGIKITTIVKVKGPLKFVWIKLVAQGIVDTLPKQMENLVKLAKEKNG